MNKYRVLSILSERDQCQTGEKRNILHWEQGALICPGYHFKPITDRISKNGLKLFAENEQGVIFNHCIG